MRHAHIYLVKRPKGRAARLHHHAIVEHRTSRRAAHTAAEAQADDLTRRNGREYVVLSHFANGQAPDRIVLNS
jgi:hypothetical protein